VSTYIPKYKLIWVLSAFQCQKQKFVVCLLVDCTFRQNSKCPTDVTLCSAATASVNCSSLFWLNAKCPTSVPLYSDGRASVQQTFHSILLEQHMFNKCSTLVCWKGKCPTSFPIYSGWIASVQQVPHSVLLEHQVSNNCCTLFWWNGKCPQIFHAILVEQQMSNTCATPFYWKGRCRPTLFYWKGRCPTSVPLYSTGTEGVQQASHSILLERQVSNKCLTLLHWKSRCPTSVPLYISQGPCSRRDIPEDPGWNSYQNILSGLLQCVANFHILSQASSLIIHFAPRGKRTAYPIQGKPPYVFRTDGCTSSEPYESRNGQREDNQVFTVLQQVVYVVTTEY
jgi:hypothetical protein